LAATRDNAPMHIRLVWHTSAAYEVRGDTVVHWIDVSLFPNWSGAEQIRPFSYSHDELVLRTPQLVRNDRAADPATDDDGVIDVLGRRFVVSPFRSTSRKNHGLPFYWIRAVVILIAFSPPYAID
jgi:hypothetical protein